MVFKKIRQKGREILRKAGEKGRDLLEKLRHKKRQPSTLELRQKKITVHYYTRLAKGGERVVPIKTTRGELRRHIEGVVKDANRIELLAQEISKKTGRPTVIVLNEDYMKILSHALPDWKKQLTGQEQRNLFAKNLKSGPRKIDKAAAIARVAQEWMQKEGEGKLNSFIVTAKGVKLSSFPNSTHDKKLGKVIELLALTDANILFVDAQGLPPYSSVGGSWSQGRHPRSFERLKQKMNIAEKKGATLNVVEIPFDTKDVSTNSFVDGLDPNKRNVVLFNPEQIVEKRKYYHTEEISEEQRKDKEFLKKYRRGTDALSLARDDIIELTDKEHLAPEYHTVVKTNIGTMRLWDFFADKVREATGKSRTHSTLEQREKFSKEYEQWKRLQENKKKE